MNLKEIYSNNDKKGISFEFFPPKETLGQTAIDNLYNEFEILKQYKPSMVSVTYGAGGSNRAKSIDIIKHFSSKDINVMPHFTCICASKDSVDNYLAQIKELNIQNVLALRGDKPKDVEVCPVEFRYANELVEYIKSNTELSVAVAGYPEGHPDASDLETDIKNLKRKIEAGADAIYTQVFFDNDKLNRYIDSIRNIEIKTPVVAGIFPVTSYKSILRMIELSNVTIPKAFHDKIEKFQDDKKGIKEIGIEYATKQCQDLMNSDIAGYHFYTLNKAYSTCKILDNLGIR